MASFASSPIGSVATIAVIDDDPAVRSSLKFSLELEGFSVRVFGSADAFLRKAGFAECACLLVDYAMPDMNGLELVTELRRLNINVPVILITGKCDRRIVALATDAGVSLVEKPFLGNSLKGAIDRAIAHA